MEETVYVVALDDNTDGEAYETEKHEMALPDVFTTAIRLLTAHDHVCVIDKSDYHALNEHTIGSMARYSINISAGSDSYSHSKIL